MVLLALVAHVQSRTVATACEHSRNDGNIAPTPKDITLDRELKFYHLSCSCDTEIVFAPLAPEA